MCSAHAEGLVASGQVPVQLVFGEAIAIVTVAGFVAASSALSAPQETPEL